MSVEFNKSGRNYNYLVLLLDTVISLTASLFALFFVRWLIHPILNFQDYVLIWAGASIGASIVGFLIFSTHKIVIRHSSYRSIRQLALATVVKELLLLLVLYFNLFEFTVYDGGFLLMIADLVFTLLSLIIVRVVIIDIYSHMRSDYEKDVKRVGIMVYGTTDKSVSQVTRLEQSDHYNVLGFITRIKANDGQIRLDRRVYYVEGADDLEKLKQNLGVQAVLFARDSDSSLEKDGLVPDCLHLGIHLLTSPRIEVSEEEENSPVINGDIRNDFIPDGMNVFTRNIKRGIDFILSTVLIVFFSPLMLICALAVKIWGGDGPVIFSQERIGRFGRPFNIYKFRTMRADAEESGPQLFSGDDDPRLTRVGKFLRQHHLDELPQLFNVFLGDMAFIGYRPERKYYIDRISKVDRRYYFLYQIRPGVTSYATLRNGYTDSMDKMLRRLEFDLYYLRHRSMWFDIKILFQTFVNIVFGKKF